MEANELHQLITGKLLHNINKNAVITKEGDRSADWLLRPIALFDILYGDLQELNGNLPLSPVEARRYIRTMNYCSTFIRSLYIGMSMDEIYELNEAMEKMETAIARHIPPLKMATRNALCNEVSDQQMLDHMCAMYCMYIYADLCNNEIRSHYKVNCKETKFIMDNVKTLLLFTGRLARAMDTNARPITQAFKDKIVQLCSPNIEAGIKAFVNAYQAAHLAD